MSGFVMITNLPTAKAAAARHNDKTVEITGQTGHFWLDFDSAGEAQEWWEAMVALNISQLKPNSLIPSDRSSFTEPKKSETPPARKPEVERTELNASNVAKFKVMAPVRQVPTPKTAPTSSFVPSSSPPPIKSYQSSSTIHSSASSSFCPRPTPPCQSRLSQTTSPKHLKPKETNSRKSRLMNRKTPDFEHRDHSRNRQQLAARPVEPREEADVLQLYRCYEETRIRKTSDPSGHHGIGSLMSNRDLQNFVPKSFHASIENFLAPIRSEMDDVKVKLDTINKENDLLRDQVKIMRRQLDEERNARRLLESRIFSWRQSFYDDAMMQQHDAE